MIRHIWLKKPWNFEHVPSNLLGRLIHGSFAWGGVVGIHHNDVNVWVHWRWTTDSRNDWFSCCMCLGAIRIYSMDVTIFSLDVAWL